MPPPDPTRSVTQIDLEIRTKMSFLAKQSDPDTRRTALEELNDLKERRLKMVAPKGYDRMLTALK